MSEPAQPVLTIDEVADWLGMHRNSVHRAARQGRLPARRVGKEWRFLAEAVAARWTPGRRLRGPAGPVLSAPAVPESPVELSAQQAADFLRVEPNTIYHEAAADRLPAWKEGHEWRTSAFGPPRVPRRRPRSGRALRARGRATQEVGAPW